MTYPNLENEKLIAIDIETYDNDIQDLGPGPRRDGYILGVGIAVENKSWYFDKPGPSFYDYLQSMKHRNFVGANIMYDLDYLQYMGFKPKNVFDIQFAEPLLNENLFSYSLNNLAKRYQGMTKGEADLIKFCEENRLKGRPQKWLYKMPSEMVGKYCKLDCELTYDIFKKQYGLLKKENLLNVFYMECGLIPLLLQMRKTGVRVDLELLEKNKIKYARKIKSLQKALNKEVGFDLNVNAARSIKKAFDFLGYECSYTEKGNPSFKSEILEKHHSQLAKDILELRQTTKTLNTFLIGLERFIVGDRIHCEFHPLRGTDWGTVTGRFSCSRPNLQQIPSRRPQVKKDIRALFIPEDGHQWVRGDYSQVELRILAHYARGRGAEEIKQMYIDNPKVDFHQACADMIGIDRDPAKTINFGVVYGMGKQKLCDGLKLSFEEGSKVLQNYHNKMPFLKKTSYDASTIAGRRGYVKTILGRKRRFPDRKYSYKALNAIIQGTAAEVMKSAMLESYKAGLFDVLVPHLTIHDEIDISYRDNKEGKEALKEMKNIFENVIEFKIPLIVDFEVGKNWGNLKEMELKDDTRRMV